MACLSDQCPSVNFTTEETGQHCVQSAGAYDCFVFTERLLTSIILHIAVIWQCMVLQYYNQMMATLTPDIRGCGTAWGLGTGLGMVHNTLKVLNWKKTIMEVYSENGYSWLPYYYQELLVALSGAASSFLSLIFWPSGCKCILYTCTTHINKINAL